MPTTDFSKKLIFFDFDGVMVDTLDMCARIIFEKNPFPDVVDHIKRVSEGNVTEQLRKLYAQGRFRWDPEFHTKYSEQLQFLSLVSGIEEVVKNLHGDHDLTIVSSSHTDPIRSFLLKQNLHTHFEDIDGVDVHHKKTEKMSSQLQKRGLTIDECVFVTDTLGDIREAHELGIPAIGVTWGYHPRETLQKGNPHAIAHTPSEIITHIRELFDRT